MQQRLSLISLGVRDLPASRSFYLQGLGWKESSAGNETICFIPLNGVVLGLYPRHLLAEDCGLPDSREHSTAFSGITLAYNARTREEVDQVLAHAQHAGAPLLKPAQDVFWGGYSGYFADPDGYAWEVAWNPGFDIDDAGNVHIPEYTDSPERN